ncbi:MAG: Hsp20/alpha crystallin family protein [Planctomycetota bacterium]
MFDHLLQSNQMMSPWRQLMNMAGMGVGVHSRIPFGAVNVWNNEDSALVAVALPGVDADEVELTVQDKQLTIRATRKAPVLAEGEQMIRRERESGTIERTVTLAHRVDADRVEAQFANGMLNVRLPRVEQEKPRRVTIQTTTGGNTSMASPTVTPATPAN